MPNYRLMKLVPYDEPFKSSNVIEKNISDRKRILKNPSLSNTKKINLLNKKISQYNVYTNPNVSND